VLFIEGDMTQSEYRTQKDTLTQELAMLPTVGNPNSEAGERLASYLADVSKAWNVATAEERNKIARALFGTVYVDNKQAVACLPRPELESFFRTLAVKPATESCKGGSDGIRTRDPVINSDVGACCKTCPGCWPSPLVRREMQRPLAQSKGRHMIDRAGVWPGCAAPVDQGRPLRTGCEHRSAPRCGQVRLVPTQVGDGIRGGAGRGACGPGPGGRRGRGGRAR
jgi:hypothetical protein